MLFNSNTIIFVVEARKKMNELGIQIKISQELFLKDPQSTDLGKRIVSASIALIDELGFEAFTFKKLGVAIGSPESSVYRYFGSKHQLLVYLLCWYWSWIEYKIVFGTINASSSAEKLEKALTIIAEPTTMDNTFIHVNEIVLHKIVVSESTKVFHTKAIEAENEKGYFAVYKRIVRRISEFIMEVNPTYKFPCMLVTTILEGVIEQNYFGEYLPSITDENQGDNRVLEFYKDLIFKTIT